MAGIWLLSRRTRRRIRTTCGFVRWVRCPPGDSITRKEQHYPFFCVLPDRTIYRILRGPEGEEDCGLGRNSQVVCDAKGSGDGGNWNVRT